MQPNIPQLKPQLNKKNQMRTLVLNKKLISKLVLLSFLGLGAVLLAPKTHAYDVARANSNLFEERYIEQNDRHLKSLKASPDTTLELGVNQEAETTRMLENGFDMMGTSEFISSKIPAELAQTYGKKIKADAVLVYDKPTSLTTNMVSLDGTAEGKKMMQEANDENARNKKTIHSASYWAKLPMPLFGVHVIKLIPAENLNGKKAPEVPGLRVIAVIKTSPAAISGVLKGDNLLKIGEITLEKSDDLFSSVQQYAGQTVPVEVLRGNEIVQMQVALNPRK